MILGDINLDTSQFPLSKNVQSYLNILRSYNYKQIIAQPTRYSVHRASTLDHIVLDAAISNFKAKIVDCGFSDHDAISIKLPTDSIVPKQHHKFFSYRCMRNFNKDQLIEDFRNMNWNTFYSINEPNSQWNVLKSFINSLWDKHAPLKRVRCKHRVRNKPWVDGDVIKLMKQRDKLYVQYKNTMDENTRSEFKQLRNKVTNLISRKRFHYYRDRINSNGRKDWWNQVNKLLGNTDKSPININAEEMATYFESIPDRVRQEINVPQESFMNYLGPHADTTLHFYNCQEQDVVNMIKNCKGSKSSGVDNISSMTLKVMANVLGYPLATLFNNCLRHEYIPRDWKLSKVVPVFKKGDRGNPENYRPISLLPTISKLYEKFLSYQMNNYLESNNVLSNRQHGFRRNRSTETAVLSLTEKITSSLERQNYTTAFFLDLSKAFDTVDHDILLRKLLHYGIVGKSYKILKDYLSYRRFFVCINDQTS